VRPVNLIPLDQRRGAARGSSRRSPSSVYIFLGVLGAAVLCVLSLVLTSNQIKDKTGQIAQLQAKEEGAKSVADALRPYGEFATTQKGRAAQIEQVAQNRFDWHHAVDQLARTTPPNVWLVSVAGTVKPGIQVDSGGGSASTLRDKVDSPAFALVGCTYSQRGVARMMARMNNIDGVTQVQLGKSAKLGETSGAQGADAAAAAASAGGAASGAQDCVGSSRVTKFELMVAFGASQATSSATAAGVPQGSAAQLAKAQGAAAQAQPGPGGSP
jgi:Tfp pilus assembly protein PilN